MVSSGNFNRKRVAARGWFYSLGGSGLRRTAAVMFLQPGDFLELDRLSDLRQLNGPMLERVHVD